MLSFIAKRLYQQCPRLSESINHHANLICAPRRLYTEGIDGSDPPDSNKKISSSKKSVDYSRVPVLNENDLAEQFVRGSGPGGQAVNKTNNCVMLRHIPTNIVIRCHMHRSAGANRKEARRLLIEKLDERENGSNSVANQLKAILQKKSRSQSNRRKKLDEMKEKWKQRENIDD